MRTKALLALIAVVFVSMFAGATAINPTTTLSAETSNNTSAANSWTTSSNSNVHAGNVSKVNHHTLLYPGTTTKIYSNIMYWFGPKNHIQVGYNSGTVAQIHKQVDDHISRGIDGTIVNWYGQAYTLDNGATIEMMKYAQSIPGVPFKFAIMEDKGALVKCANTLGCDVHAQLIKDLTYIYNTFTASPAYIKVGGRPVVYFFWVDRYGIDWNYVQSKVPGNMMYIFQNNAGFSDVHADGSYSWVQINKANTADWMQSYLDSFYLTGNKHPMEYAVGATWKGFNDTVAAWSLNRIMKQDCGQVWLKTWNEVKKYYSQTNQLDAMQIVTWNDYEEGTEVETGIDNCVAVSASVSGTNLNWAISGGLENTIDHYQVYASLDGQNLAPLDQVPAGTHTLDLVQFNLDPASYKLYVQAVGKPSITNKMSAATVFNLSTSGPVVSLSVSASSAVAQSTIGASVSAYSSAGSIASTSIDFGDGTIVPTSSATHAYKVPGTYTITAKATDTTGASVTQSKVITVVANKAPIASISLNMTNGVAPATVAVNTSGSSDPDGSIISTTIKFGDGSAAVSGPTASHAYSAAGSYAVTVTVTDDRGAQSSASATVTLKAANVTISQPTAGATSVSPVLLTGTSLAPTGRSMGAYSIYVDNNLATTAAAGALNKSLAMAVGTHTILVKAWDSTGAVYSDSTTVKVVAKAGLTVTAPTAASTVSTSTHFVANATPPAGASITTIRIYVDGVQKYSVNGAKVDTYVTLAAGTRSIAIQAWDNQGAVYKWSTSLTVK